MRRSLIRLLRSHLLPGREKVAVLLSALLFATPALAGYIYINPFMEATLTATGLCAGSSTTNNTTHRKRTPKAKTENT